MAESLYSRLVIERLAKNRQTMEPKPPIGIPEEERIKAADPSLLSHPAFDGRQYALYVYQEVDGKLVCDVYTGLDATAPNCELVGKALKDAAEKAGQPELNYMVLLVQPLPEVPTS